MNESTPPPPRKNRRLFARLAALLLLPYAAVCMAVVAFEKRLTFYPTAEIAADPSSVQLDFEDVWIETGEERVHGWYVPHAKARASVLFLHGNAGNISGRLDTLRILHGLGLSVLIIDYPGYGRSGGAVGEEACNRSARAALAELASRTPEGEPLLVWGRSLGGGVASSLAQSERVRLLILESTFTSLPDLAQQLYPWLPARWLASMSFPSRERVRATRLPVLVIHSADDQLIPISHGKALVEAAGARGTFVPINGGHGDGFLISGSRYIDPIDAFLTRQLGG